MGLAHGLVPAGLCLLAPCGGGPARACPHCVCNSSLARSCRPPLLFISCSAPAACLVRHCSSDSMGALAEDHINDVFSNLGALLAAGVVKVGSARSCAVACAGRLCARLGPRCDPARPALLLHVGVARLAALPHASPVQRRLVNLSSLALHAPLHWPLRRSGPLAGGWMAQPPS